VTNVLAGLDSGIDGCGSVVPANHFFDGLMPEVGDAVRAALDVLVSAGARLVEVTVPDVEISSEVITTIVGVEAALIHRQSWPPGRTTTPRTPGLGWWPAPRSRVPPTSTPCTGDGALWRASNPRCPNGHSGHADAPVTAPPSVRLGPPGVMRC